MILLLTMLFSIPFPMPPMTPTLSLHPVQPTPAPYHAHVVSTAIITQTQLPVTGEATYYGRGIFKRVIRNRIRWGHIAEGDCPECIGYVAMIWFNDIGRRVCLEVDGFVFGPYLVIDNAARHDRQGLIDRDWVIDLEYETWKAFEFWNAPVQITVRECHEH